MPRLLSIPGALYELARLAVISRFRFGGAYWSWRWQTAAGSGAGLTRREKAAAMLEYGRWVRSMRRL